MHQRSCPRCGGTDRFYLIAHPRQGGAPFWLCNQCRYYEAAEPGAALAHSPLRRLSEAEQRQAQHGYAAVADWCAQCLWTLEGRPALEYLRQRGFSDDMIVQARLGFHPNTPTDGVGPYLWNRDREAYEGARLGGLLGPQGRPKSLLRGAITIPYYHQGTCTLLRTRTLDPSAPAKYCSPAGVALYAGSTPTLYLADRLQDANTILLTEGEWKALLPHQYGIAAVGQPGIGYLPDAFVLALAGKTVVVCYDVEQRRDPFQLSPGEQGTLRTVARLTGLDLQERVGQLAKLLAELKGQKPNDANEQTLIATQAEILRAQLAEAREQIERLRALRISVRVLRLPRAADETKIDLDSFLLAHGPTALQQLLAQAPDGTHWHAAHYGGGFRYDHGGMANGQPIANYQARITETIYQNDGQAVTALQRLALRTPSGRRLMCDIPDEEWADDRAARQSVRVGLREGTFDDNPRDVLRAIRLLSNQGDPPVERHIYTCTGWEQIAGRWHFLASDGAVTASGISTTMRAEIDPEAAGNHYALCGAGDAQQGAAAWLGFLRGDVCPQPLALILAGHAALSLIHRFTGNAARSMFWLFHETGSLKTALIRAGCMGLYGASFTAERADGAPVPKWDATSVGLGLLVFYYRDLPVLIDDYKTGMINPEQFKRFLHNYSEGTGRTRGTKHQNMDRMKPARAIVFSTAEDVPASGSDPGVQARLLSMVLKPEQVNTDALAALQRAGAAGHLAAFWRGLIQALASELDRHGVQGMQTLIQNQIRADDERLPGHRRTAGSLRQNRAAWLVLSSWLQKAGYISAEEAQRLDAAHLEARTLLADVLESRQRESRPSVIFLSVLSELISAGDLVIEREGMTCPRCGAELNASEDGWFCSGVVGERDLPCAYHLPNARIVGFQCEDGIGLHANKAFREVSRVRNDQRQPFAYSSTAIWQQLDADGVLAGRAKEGLHRVPKRNSARRGPDGKGIAVRVLLLKAGTLDGWSESNADLDVQKLASLASLASQATLARPDAEAQQDAFGIPWHPTPETWHPTQEISAERMVGMPEDAKGCQVWHPTFEAPERDESMWDAKDANFLDHQNKKGKKVGPLWRRLRIPRAAFEEACAAWQLGNSFAVNKVARAHNISYANMIAAIEELEEQTHE